MNWKFWTWPRQIREHHEAFLRSNGVFMETMAENTRLKNELKSFTELRSSMPIWDEKDDLATAHFFTKTESGQRLMQALESIGHLKAQNAVCGKTKDDREYNTHIAGGWFNCVFYLKSLSSKFQLAQKEQDSAAKGEKPFAETYSP